MEIESEEYLSLNFRFFFLLLFEKHRAQPDEQKKNIVSFQGFSNNLQQRGHILTLVVCVWVFVYACLSALSDGGEGSLKHLQIRLANGLLQKEVAS
jgi:hypothetical protein